MLNNFKQKSISLLFYLILSISSFSYTPQQVHNDIEYLLSFVNDTQSITIDDIVYDIDLRRLLNLTAMMESNYSRDNYSNRIAKTFMQLEEDTALHYINIIPEYKNYIEEIIDKDLNHVLDEDAIYVSYLVYMSKLTYHYDWIDKYKYIFYETNDLEWFIYKLFYNSVKGKSKFSVWEHRENQFIKMEGDILCSKEV